MKLFDDGQYDYLEYSLKKTYHGRQIPELSLRWKQSVMRAVRSIGPLTATFNHVVFVQHFVWRLLTAACVVVVMLLGYMWYLGVNPFHDVHELLLEDSMQVLVLRQAYEEF